MSPSCRRHVSFFMLICPFLMLSPSFSYAPWRRWDGGSPSISMSPSCRRHVSLFMLICPFLMLSPSFSYAPWRRWDGGVSLHLHVSILLSTRFFVYANLSFSYAAPSSSYAPRRGWDGREGHPFTRPDLFWCYPLCGAGFFLCCACPFLMLHGALSMHLHVSPSISMSPILLSTCLFSDCEPYLFLCGSCPSYAPWAKGGGRGGHGAH